MNFMNNNNKKTKKPISELLAKNYVNMVNHLI